MKWGFGTFMDYAVWLDCMKNSQLLGHLVDVSKLEELVNFGSPRSDNLNLEVQNCSFPTFFSVTRKCFVLFC